MRDMARETFLGGENGRVKRVPYGKKGRLGAKGSAKRLTVGKGRARRKEKADVLVG